MSFGHIHFSVKTVSVSQIEGYYTWPIDG